MSPFPRVSRASGAPLVVTGRCRYCKVVLSGGRHLLSFEEESRLHEAERAGDEPWVEPTLESFGVA